MRISYFPAGNASQASSRLRVWKIAEALADKGHDILINDTSLTNVNVVVVQKRTDCDEIMVEAHNTGIPVIYDADDWIPSLPVELANVITVDTPEKKRLWKQAVVIPDALDVEDNFPVLKMREQLGECVWVGNTDNLYHIKHMLLAATRLNLRVLAITDINHSNFGDIVGPYRGLNLSWIDWTPQTVDVYMRTADLFVAPLITNGKWSADWVTSKSANRVLKAWGLGLPCAATPIPSYLDVGLQYHASSYDDWLETLTWLGSKELRERDAQRGFKIAQEFTADKIALKWLEVFERAKGIANRV